MNPFDHEEADTYATMIESLQPLAAVLREKFPPPVVEPPPPPVPVVYETPDALNRALSAAVYGDVLLVSPTLVYNEPLVLRTGVMLQSSAIVPGLIPVDFPAPKFLGGITLAAEAAEAKIVGLEARHPVATGEIVTMLGHLQVADRCRVMGNPTTGTKRGIRFRGSAGKIVQCYVDDIFQPAQDTQAIYCDDMHPAGGLEIDQSFLRAAGEVIMFGGGGRPIERRPHHLRLTNSVLTKKPEWVELVTPGVWGKHRQQIKNALEFKDLSDGFVDNCDFEYAGTTAGQRCFLIVGTPRNQDGKAEGATVERITITNSRGRHAGGLLTLNGDDNLFPSGLLTDWTLQNFVMEDLNHKQWGGPGQIVYLNRGTVNVHVEDLTVTGQNMKSCVYFDESKPPVGLVVRRINAPIASMPYPWHNKYGDTIAKALQYAPDAVLEP